MRSNPEVKLRGDRNECPSCGELFNSTVAFSKHRIGKFGVKGDQTRRRCRTVAEMTQVGMVKTAAGFWATHLQTPESISSLCSDE